LQLLAVCEFSDTITPQIVANALYMKVVYQVDMF